MGNHSCSAQILYWDSNGKETGAGNSPSGIWGIDAFWSLSSLGDVPTGAYIPGSDVVFSADADAIDPYMVTVVGTQVVNSITFEEGAVTMTGDTLQLGGGGINVTTTDPAGITISSNIELTDKQTWTITKDTVLIGSGIISGATKLSKAGEGTLILSGANTFSEGLRINEGMVIGTTSTAFGSGLITVGDSSGSAATILNAGYAGTFTNAIWIAGGNTGLATITSSANATFSGAITLDFHDLELSTANDNLTVSGGITGTGNITLNASGAGTITLSTSKVDHNGTITNTSTGPTTVTISASVGSNVTAITENSISSGLTISGGLTVNSNGTTLTNNNASGSSLLTMSGNVIGNGNLNLNNNSSIANGIFFSNGFGLINNVGRVINSGTGTGNTLINASIASNVTGVIQKSAASQLILSGNSSFTSGVTIEAGTVKGTSANAFGLGTITIGNTSGSANATLDGGFAGTFSNPILVNAGNTGIATITSSANSTFNGPVTLSFHNLRLLSTSYALTLSGGIGGTGDLALNAFGTGIITLSLNKVDTRGTITNSGTGTATNIITASIGGNVTAITENSTSSALTISGALTVNGNGTSLTNSNASGSSLLTLSGNVTGGGNLTLKNNSAISNGITFSNGFALINNVGMVINSGTGTGNTFINASIASNVTGVIQNSATSQLTLSGNSSFTSGITIAAGIVRGTNSGAFGLGTITIGNISGSANATLDGGYAGTFTNLISIASGNSGIATITSSANTTFSGSVTLNSHDLRLLSTSHNLTLSGGIDGTGNLTLNATGTSVITLNNSKLAHNGTITNASTGTATNIINASIENVTAIIENSISSTLMISGLTVNSNGTTLTNNNAGGSSLLTITGDVTGTGDLILNNNSAIANGINFSNGFKIINNVGKIVNFGTGTGGTLINASIASNVMGVTQKSSTSQLILSGNSNFTSGVKIEAGTVKGITSPNAFGLGTITIGAGSGSADTTLDGGLAGTFSNPISIASGNTGIATITSSANTTFIGPVTLNSHNLQLSSVDYNLTLSGGIAGSGDLTLNAKDEGHITLLTSTVNNTGKIINSGSGTATNIINAPIGSNVTGVIQNSATSALNLTGSNYYTSETSVTAGTLFINGNNVAATGNVTVTAGATLGGAGIVGGATTVNGTHNSGYSSGLQTFTNGLSYNNATVNWELFTNSAANRGSNYDAIDVTGGGLMIAGTTTLNLVFNHIDSTVNWSSAFWNTSKQWIFYDVTNTRTGTFILGNVSLDSLGVTFASARPGAFFNITYSGSDVLITYNAIPEPQTWMLILLGASMPLIHCYRTRNSLKLHT